MRCTVLPRVSAVTAASSATGVSDVPAALTTAHVAHFLDLFGVDDDDAGIFIVTAFNGSLFYNLKYVSTCASCENITVFSERSV